MEQTKAAAGLMEPKQLTVTGRSQYCKLVRVPDCHFSCLRGRLSSSGSDSALVRDMRHTTHRGKKKKKKKKEEA